MCGGDKDSDSEAPQSSLTMNPEGVLSQVERKAFYPMRDCWIEADFAKEYLDASTSPRDRKRRVKNLKIASMLGIFSLIIIYYAQFNH